MKTTFFTVEIADAFNTQQSWELVTFEGGKPDQDIYYILNGMPSHNEEVAIDNKIESGDYTEVPRDFNDFTNKSDSELLEEAREWAHFVEPEE